jgi:methylenetetrahydrofolate dehydrogenase (NADP+)/methenyltetrahydrofolate cyclohydrolase
MATLLDGNLIAGIVRSEVANEVNALITHGKATPHIAAVLIGADPASETYVFAKVKACEAVGITSTLIRKDASISEEELQDLVRQLNEDPEIDGYIVQLPLPAHINEAQIIGAVDPEKDVDGFHPLNFGRMCLGLDGYIPATPAGIVEILKRYHIATEGKHCVVVGRSPIVGLPISVLMQRNANPGNCTVTIAHSRTADLKSVCLSADILIVAIGKAAFITADMVKPGAVVVDVGISRIEDSSKKSGYRLCGDVDFVRVEPICSYITPVPGGVGPMTIAMLLSNTLKASLKRR